jgi:hypothetical protein
VLMSEVFHDWRELSSRKLGIPAPP